MFDLRTALMPLNGRALTLRELCGELERICAAHLSELPAEFGIDECLSAMRRRGWLLEDSAGRLYVQVEGPDSTRTTRP